MPDDLSHAANKPKPPAPPPPPPPRPPPPPSPQPGMSCQRMRQYAGLFGRIEHICSAFIRTADLAAAAGAHNCALACWLGRRRRLTTVRERLSQMWGQGVVVENRQGADGIVAVNTFGPRATIINSSSRLEAW